MRPDLFDPIAFARREIEAAEHNVVAAEYEEASTSAGLAIAAALEAVAIRILGPRAVLPYIYDTKSGSDTLEATLERQREAIACMAAGLDAFAHGAFRERAPWPVGGTWADPDYEMPLEEHEYTEAVAGDLVTYARDVVERVAARLGPQLAAEPV